MYSGFPGLALILVVSAAPKKKTVENETVDQKLVPKITDPIRGTYPLFFCQFFSVCQAPTLE